MWSLPLSSGGGVSPLEILAKYHSPEPDGHPTLNHEALAPTPPTLCHADRREGRNGPVSPLPPPCQVHGRQDESPPIQLVEALECTLDTLEITKPLPSQDLRSPNSCPDPQHGTKHTARRPTGSSHRGESMPTAPESATLDPARKLWLTGCVVHSTPDTNLLSIQVQVEEQPVTVLLDSWSTMTLARPTMFPDTIKYSGPIKLTCVHGDA